MNIFEEVSTREFFRSYSKRKKNPTLITFRGKPEGVYIPYIEWKILNQKKVKNTKRLTKSDLKPFFVKGPGNASETVDDIYRM